MLKLPPLLLRFCGGLRLEQNIVEKLDCEMKELKIKKITYVFCGVKKLVI